MCVHIENLARAPAYPLGGLLRLGTFKNHLNSLHFGVPGTAQIKVQLTQALLGLAQHLMRLMFVVEKEILLITARGCGKVSSFSCNNFDDECSHCGLASASCDFHRGLSMASGHE